VNRPARITGAADCRFTMATLLVALRAIRARRGQHAPAVAMTIQVRVARHHRRKFRN
jgi:hypothetical protein